MGNVVVAIKPTSATGAAGITRYIAESKRIADKEGLGPNEPRPLFSYTEDNLTYLEANRLLQIPTDTQAQKEDVIHMVISPEKGHYEELGETRAERYDALKEINFVGLYWIAGIHLNSDIPHAHLAICRDGLNSLTKRRGRIDHLPRTLLSHNEKAESGEKQFFPGKVAEAVSSGIERQRQLVARRVQMARQDHPESKREIPSHEKPAQELSPHPEHDHQLTIAQDASSIELLQQPNNQHIIEANDTHIISEPQSSEIHPVTVPTVDPSLHAHTNDEQHSTDHDKQDSTATLVSHSGDRSADHSR